MVNVTTASKRLSIEFSSPVRELGTLIGRWLAGVPLQGFSITRAIADLAIRRHKCGPLLFAVALHSGHVDDDARAMLEAHWEQNKRQYLRNNLSVERIAAALQSQEIAALTFKGASLAEALYPDPLWRHCGDVDVLVSQDAMVDALLALSAADIKSSNLVLALPHWIQRILFGITRDVGVDDGWTQAHIEVHSRLLFSKRLSAILETRGTALRPQKTCKEGELATPLLDANLGLYLLFHGCVSGWCRLKWLIDLLPLLEKLGPSGRQTLADMAETSRAAAAVKASLLILQEILGRSDISPLDSWLGEAAGSAAVHSRARRYAGWLGAEESQTPAFSRMEILRSSIMLNDRLFDQTQLMLSAAFSSELRQTLQAIGGPRNP